MPRSLRMVFECAWDEVARAGLASGATPRFCLGFPALLLPQYHHPPAPQNPRPDGARARILGHALAKRTVPISCFLNRVNGGGRFCPPGRAFTGLLHCDFSRRQMGFSPCCAEVPVPFSCSPQGLGLGRLPGGRETQVNCRASVNDAFTACA